MTCELVANTPHVGRVLYTSSDKRLSTYETTAKIRCKGAALKDANLKWFLETSSSARARGTERATTWSSLVERSLVDHSRSQAILSGSLKRSVIDMGFIAEAYFRQKPASQSKAIISDGSWIRYSVIRRIAHLEFG